MFLLVVCCLVLVGFFCLAFFLPNASSALCKGEAVPLLAAAPLTPKRGEPAARCHPQHPFPRGARPGPARSSAPLSRPARGRPPRRLIALIRGTMPQIITLPSLLLPARAGADCWKGGGDGTGRERERERESINFYSTRLKSAERESRKEPAASRSSGESLPACFLPGSCRLPSAPPQTYRCLPLNKYTSTKAAPSAV